MSQVTGSNPPFKNDPNNPDKSVVDAFNEALQGDGIITRDEFQDIMQKYYGMADRLGRDVTQAAWEAFIGKKGDGAGVNLTELAKSLRFFANYRATVQAYSFDYFLRLDEVYIQGGRESAGTLRNIGIDALLAGGNPEVQGAWDAAKQLTGGQINGETWNWFSTIIMARFADKLKDKFDLSKLDSSNPLVRRLFGDYAVQWAQTNNINLTDDKWKELLAKQDTIHQIEAQYGSLSDVQIIGQSGLDKLNALINDFRSGAPAQTIQREIGQLRTASAPAAAPMLGLNGAPPVINPPVATNPTP